VGETVKIKSKTEWLAEGERWNWWAPQSAPLFFRLPVIRYFRWFIVNIIVGYWYHSGPGSIGLPSGYDSWVLHGVYRGWV
jgi:hypothetical protein